MQQCSVAARNIGLRHNVTINVLDAHTGKLLQAHEGHNAATNSMLLGIGHYLIGDGVLNQGRYMLSHMIPRYISLGTMGLTSQEADADGLPIGVGDVDIADEAVRFSKYMQQRPGYGADGYSAADNNGRADFGLGQPFSARADHIAINCELITPSYPRPAISFRDVIPETQSELPQTIDVVVSALISTGALKQFRPAGQDYIFISEVGLWTEPTWNWNSAIPEWEASGSNGLLAAYRIAPPDESNWDMDILENRNILKRNIIRVGLNQVVQVVWKLQLGSIDQFGGRVSTSGGYNEMQVNALGDEVREEEIHDS